MEPWVCPKQKKGPRSFWKTQKDPTNESKRWLRGVMETEAALGTPRLAIQVADREADQFPLLATLIQQGIRFIIRLRHDRILWKEEGEKTQRVLATLKDTEVLTQREVNLSFRKQSPFPWAAKIHPARTQRAAHVEIRTARVNLKTPKDYPKAAFPPGISIGVVSIEELHPPQGEPPVCWFLYTNEPLYTEEQAALCCGRWISNALGHRGVL